jgi:uncharacterized protein YbbK (DUF523 family)
LQKILLSACLLNLPVRYDGQGIDCRHPILKRWKNEGRIIGICPEASGGLATPRAPAEIELGQGGDRVLAGNAKVLENTGGEVSAQFIAGAKAAVQLAKQHTISIAVLKEKSPSCGSGLIYDGSFANKTITGQGVSAAALIQAGVYVFNEHQFEEADALLKQLEA